MADITIPEEALEAAAEDLFHTQYGDSKGSWADAPEWLKSTIRSEARAACLAMLQNWPGMKLEHLSNWVMDGPNLPYVEEVASIILPLPTEKPSE